jgi:hypothetical protein
VNCAYFRTVGTYSIFDLDAYVNTTASAIFIYEDEKNCHFDCMNVQVIQSYTGKNV